MTLGAVEQDDLSMSDFMQIVANLPGPARTLVKDGVPQGAFGIVVTGDEGWSWAAFSDALRACPVALHRTAMKEHEAAVAGLRVVHTTLKKNWPRGRRWLERLGYEMSGEVETPYGTLERFSKWVYQQQS